MRLNPDTRSMDDISDDFEEEHGPSTSVHPDAHFTLENRTKGFYPLPTRATNGKSEESSYASDDGEEEEEADGFIKVPEELAVVEEGQDLLAILLARELGRSGSGKSQVSSELQKYLNARKSQPAFRASRQNGFRGTSVTRSYQSRELACQEEIADALARIGDALEADQELNTILASDGQDFTYETLRNVAKTLFANGINWGRIVALLFFACKMVRNKLSQSLENSPFGSPWIKDILRWAGQIMRTYIAWWIVRRGGWQAVMEWFGPAWSQIGLAFGGFCTVCVIIWKTHQLA
ncbi:hypothetical protein RvY_17393 [Ramazzottius varieornatus]|uniref:Bcl-2 Bcl-2 homology region 1-3 domain-containing protein n=1 Tax=Ramazzottius varieornatus TaxID=947166 RepID=A0A1D1W7V5_RAMVA|nr:hypothetical protein RvY_17393 [Ramazzottius varieornatus]